jgi:hypothetical protein
LEAAEGIDLGNKVAFPDAADRRIARHLSNRAAIDGHQRHRHTHPGRRGSGLTSRMAGAHNNNVGLEHRYFPMQNAL